MSRHELRARSDYTMPPPPPSKCAKVLYYTWKLCSVVFSHFVMISLVVAYCILGAVTFEKLEAAYEREVKMNVSMLRANTTDSIWRMTNHTLVLEHVNWTRDVATMLKDFENSILYEMKVRGWDGNEAPNQIQWTFTGALFYSIIVITTIGYGHIAPKTQAGKVVTIFYAIVGIPLMLLCLSNIGDVMASSFRFLYWRVCCYVCTRPPKRRHRRHHSTRRSVRGGSGRGSTRRRRLPLSAPQTLERAHSDTDCSGYSSARALRPRPPAPAAAQRAPRTRSQPPAFSKYQSDPKEFHRERSPARFDKLPPDDYEDDEHIDFPKISLPLQDLAAALKDLEDHQTKTPRQELRSKSFPHVDKPRGEHGASAAAGTRRCYDERRYYEDDENMLEMHDLQDVDYENYRERKAREIEERERERRREERDDFGSRRDRDYDPEDDDYEFNGPRARRGWPDRDKRNRCRSEYYERDHDDFLWERRGRRARSAACDFERRLDMERDDIRHGDVETGRRRLRRLRTVDDTTRPYRYTPSPDRDDWSDVVAVVPRRSRPPAWGLRHNEAYPIQQESLTKEEVHNFMLKPVPIWLCVCLVASYIVAGTFLFKSWEQWAYLDAAYFCFITLTTIGFGDFVPAQGQRAGNPADAVHSIALCSLYLLFGIALLAMSFNLVQEEVRANVAALATRLGIIKPKNVDDSDSEY
ncbi:uncharacterized protein LOC113229625 isoform X3 [Hyposmocoma kahamanoa]|uniref:uncharacterized protein LOC113229625 isoform X3 n=1 Tax=Hyposmocoma kahamanoa TaxID=1477025 RepID=UPI000E6D7EAC|nr:uncharacterized protein LOC113229625 isoform X3 [Hyposmocoma kahamanoa]